MSVSKKIGLLAGLLLPTFPALAQYGTPATGEWRVNGGDTGSTRYSPLDQINATNVKNLQVVWRWKAQNFGPTPQTAWEVTPLMVGGMLYVTAGTVRTVAAIDAATGETKWLYNGDDTKERGAVRPVNRGLSYWSDGKGDDRILFVTPGYQLIALNAHTGAPIASFGVDAHVDLWKGLDRAEVKKESIGATSPPIIVRDVAVVGASEKVGVALPTKLNTPGYVRGYDVRTGKLLWTFHTVPQAGEPGVETGEKIRKRVRIPGNSRGTRARGVHSLATKNSGMSTFRWKRPAAILTAASVPAPICIRIAWCAWTPRPARRSGITN
jgi:glucose dehydrogenase